MLTALRTFAKSWVAAVMMGLLIVSFVGWGASKYGFEAVRGDEVIKAGSRTVSSLEFRRRYDDFKKQIEQQYGQQVTPEFAEQNKLDKVLISQLSGREAFNEMLRRAGIVPSDKLIADEIRKIPAFFDQVTGAFDKKTYAQRLQENNLNPTAFEKDLADQMATQHFLVGVGNGLQAPRAYGAFLAIMGLETRDIAYFQVTAASVPKPSAPTDAQLTAFMNEFKDRLTRPETRVITVVRFTPQIDQTAAVDPAELKKRYDFRKDTFSRPETRTIVQVPAKSQAAAQAIVQRLKANESPAAVAKSQGVEAITYDDKPQTAIPDRKLAAAAFAMQAGQIGPVQGDLGLAVVKVVSVSPGRTVSIEEARPMLEAEVRKDMATEKAYTQSQAYDDAKQGGADMAAAAAKAGAPTTTLGPVTAQGAMLNGQPVAGVTPRMLEQAFQLPSGGESELIEGDNGEYFAVRVERITPASLPPLEEIRPQLTQGWINQQTAKAMEAKGKELLARIQRGEAFDAVAASGGYAVTRAQGLSRQTAQMDQTTPREVLGRAFAARSGEAFMGPTQASTYAIGKVEKISMDAGPQVGMIAEAQRAALTQPLVGEIMAQAQAYSRDKLKIRVDPARARAAIGMEPEEPAPKGGAAKK